MKKINCFLLVLSLLLVAQTFSQTTGRVHYNFNQGWKLQVGDDIAAITRDYNDANWKLS